MKARVGDTAMKAKTGKTWAEWFAILDKAGAQNMGHTEMAAYLHNELGCPGWWNQMVAVGYEQARGTRQKHQKPGGYEISASKTMEAPIGALYKAWEDQKTRRRWLPDPDIKIRKATRNKSMRITWTDGKTSLNVNFYVKGKAKAQVVVQHSKLPDGQAAERMKTYWARMLERLKEWIH